MLQSVGLSLAYPLALLYWMKWLFLSPMKQEASDMHLSQLDPTEIIDIPYDLHRLAVYVASVAVVGMALQFFSIRGQPKWRQLLLDWIQCAVACFGIFILCGASPYRDQVHTVLAAVYMSTLCWFDPPLFLTTNDTTATRVTHGTMERLRQRVRGTGHSQQSLLASVTTQATIGVTIPFPVLLLYDRGWQVQRWPVPIILGSTMGWSIGVVLGTALALRKGFQEGLSKKREAHTEE